MCVSTKFMKKILVTGGAGFLGANLCRKIIAKEPDAQVICLDNLYTGKRSNVYEIESENFYFIKHDITEPINLEVDEIYNLACPASPPHYQKDHVFTLKTCFLGTLNLLELARRNNARFLQASTSEVYGDPDITPQKESYWGRVNCTGLRSCYDEGKRSAESLVLNYKRMHNTDVRIVRIFNTYGPFMDPEDGRVVSNFIMQCLTNKPITVYGTGEQTRSICYVDDLINAIYKMMHVENFTGPVNIGNPDEYKIIDLALKIKNLTNSSSEIVYKKAPSDDPMQSCPDVSLVKEKLKWSPQISSN